MPGIELLPNKHPIHCTVTEASMTISVLGITMRCSEQCWGWNQGQLLPYPLCLLTQIPLLATKQNKIKQGQDQDRYKTLGASI